MSKKYFGTDGIRGLVNKFPMTPEIALKCGIALGYKFTNKDKNYRHRVVIAKDTRLSGYVIEPALTSGLAAAGMDVFLVGPLPTPAVSMLTKSLRADLGIMISASHNPYHDNGIKIFDSQGHKLGDEIEKEIEAMLDDDVNKFLAKSDMLGRVKRMENPRGRYIEFVKNSFPKDLNLSGLRIVVDCANGSSYYIAPIILWELGAEVIAINNEPDGFNINENCGSTSPETLSKKVLQEKADIGIALDGDADRLLVVDEKGQVVDGDILIGLIAKHLKDTKKLKKDKIVATQMSNIALDNFLAENSIELLRCNVGDRYVIEKMREVNSNFGAEKSGHIILSDFSTTGDGLVAALQILSILIENKGKKVSQITNIFTLAPQILVNVKLKNDQNPLENSQIIQKIDQIRQKNPENRIFIRKSGTEPLIRIMAEGGDQNLIKEIANQISKILD